MINFLIIDDDEGIRSLLKIILKKNYACKIQEAENGEHGFDLLKLGSTDIVFLDLNMPVMDGKQVLNQIRIHPILRTLPVIIITAMNEKETIAELIDKGICDYILKPFDKTDTVKRINKTIAKKISSKNSNNISDEPNSSGLPRLMLVETDNKARNLFHDLFANQFIILDAKNGTEAIQIFTKHYPRYIIVSDNLNLLDKKIIMLRIQEMIKNGEASIYLLINDFKSATAKVFSFDGIIVQDENPAEFKREVLDILQLEEFTTN